MRPSLQRTADIADETGVHVSGTYAWGPHGAEDWLLPGESLAPDTRRTR